MSNLQLSPQASSSVPSPTSEFPQYLTHLTNALDHLTSHAAGLPEKVDLQFHRSLDRDFRRELDKTSERILTVTEKILSLVEASHIASQGKDKGKGKVQVRRRALEDQDDVVDGYRASVLGVVDGLLEDADSNLDELKGSKGKTAIKVKPALAAKAGKKIPGPFAEHLPQYMMHAAHIVKPQLLFHDPPDNFSTHDTRRTTLTSKPHAMVPLGFEMPLEYELSEEEEMNPTKAIWRKEKEARMRRHPYYYETKHLSYPTSMFIDSPPIPFRAFEETPFEYVDNPEKLEIMVAKLKQAKAIAVDLEHHDMRSYAGFTCLMQISTREEDWVVDTLALRREIKEGKFGDVFTDPSIIKVFHGAEADIIWLQQDFGIHVVNLFDTYHASVTLDLQQRSLSALLQLYCHYDADKRYQRADWRIRPLPDVMVQYARADTHFLLFVYDNLRNALLHKSSRPPSPEGFAPLLLASAKPNPQAAMRVVLERSAETALRLYEPDPYDEENGRGTGGWLMAGKKWLPEGGIDMEVGWVWRHLHAYRDKIARDRDESPFYVMPQLMLRDVCFAKISDLGRIIKFDRAPIASQHITEIAAIITKAKKEWKKIAANRIKNPAAEGIVQSSGSRIKFVETAAPGVHAIPAVVSDYSPINVWDKVSSPAASKPAPKSGLFGSTIKSSTGAAASPRPRSRSPKGKKTSGLFGQTSTPQPKKKNPTRKGRVMSLDNAAESPVKGGKKKKNRE